MEFPFRFTDLSPDFWKGSGIYHSSLVYGNREIGCINWKGSISRVWERKYSLSPEFGIQYSGDNSRCWEMLGMLLLSIIVCLAEIICQAIGLAVIIDKNRHIILCINYLRTTHRFREQ